MTAAKDQGDDFAELARRARLAVDLRRAETKAPRAPERPTRALWQGHECQFCGAQKLRPVAGQENIAVCFGCGRQGPVTPAQMADIEAQAKETEKRFRSITVDRARRFDPPDDEGGQ